MDWMIPRHWWKQYQDQQWRAAVATVMMNQTISLPPYYRDLLALTATLIAEGRHELAVIVAQMACEVISEQTLTPLMKKPEPRQTFNVHAKEVLKLYKRLTHDPIDSAAFWTAYGTHAIRRHEVVHRGRRVNPTEARDSLAVATQFVDHVEKVQRSLR